MKISIQRWNEGGTPRRLHTGISPGKKHVRRYVLWRIGKPWRTRELFGAPSTMRWQRTVTLVIERRCPEGTITGCIRECMGIGQ